MTVLHTYDSDPYRTHLDAEIVRLGEECGRLFAVLSDTVFYPEGGGQPADRGTINGVDVVDVQEVDGEVRHFIASPLVPGPAKLQLDWARRFDHMQQHTGQHLLTALALDRFKWATTAFHLGEELSDVELAVPGLSRKQLDELEALLAAEIRGARPVSSCWVSPEEYPNLNVRSRRLPEGHQGDLRLVEIAGVDLNTCCGTHVRNTAELEMIKLLDTESLRGGTRVFFVVGGRARWRLAQHEARNGKLRTLLDAPDADLAPALETKLDQLRSAERRARRAEDEMADLLVEALATRPGKLAEHHFEGKDAGFMQKAARSLAGAAPSKLVFFTTSSSDAAFFTLAAGETVDVDAAALGKEIAGILGAKGGGSGRFFQGKAGSLENREQVLARLRESLA